VLRRILATFTVIAALVVVGGLTEAATAGRDRRIACYQRGTGAVRLIRVGHLPRVCPDGWVRFT
jgi:hypothetical protein